MPRPPAIVRGNGALVWDADGKEYVDMLAGFSVSNTGHCHPAVTAALAMQAGRLLHYFDLPGEPRERLATRLAALAPGERRRRVMFGTTGADEAGWMLDFCVREGLLFEKGGYYYNRFQLIPALVMEKELIDRAVGILDRAMSMAEARAGIPGGS
jgi:4-aminobutyrate aminotransferase-like enzyme